MKAEELQLVAVIGAGTMGPGIALAFAASGCRVRLGCRSQKSCQKGLQMAAGCLDTLQKHGLLDAAQSEAALARIEPAEGLEAACAGVQMVVEAVPENLALKQEIFAELGRLCPAEAVLASNTSGLSISALGRASGRPGQVVGAHFWNPPHLLPLVEVVRGEETTTATMEFTAAVMTRIGKEPVMVNRDLPGFVGTRLHQALIREAFYLVEQGVASAADVDKVVKASFGRRLAVTGPLETCDLGGLDVFLAAAGSWADLSNAAAPSPLLAQAVEQGRLGAKSGRGLYDWDPQTLERILREREAVLIHFLKRDQGLV